MCGLILGDEEHVPIPKDFISIRLEELKQNVKILLMNKKPVELGRFDAKLLGRSVRHVPWKDAVVQNLGWEWVENYRKKYPAQYICDVLVEEQATLPLWKNGDQAKNN